VTLRVSDTLSLPLDVAGETTAVLAKRGAGKTNTATVLVEELVGAGVQTVILDPVGAWWGIRHSADGKKPGLSIPILGGQHGDVPVEKTAGALIADVAVDARQSLLIDLSDLPSKAAANQFVTDFAERLYRRKARQQSLLHLVLEEADEFAPQSGKGTERMRGAIEQIVRRGRSRGLGVTLITQRSAVLNKDVLTQADVLIVMRTTGPHDLRAIREWVSSRGDEHGGEVLHSLPELTTGEAWIWNPERDLIERVMIRRRATFDSSRTPKAGEQRAEPGRAAPIDLEALGEKIAATAEKAKAEDPAELRRQIRELEAKATNLEGKMSLLERATTREPEVVETTVEVPVLTDDERRDLEAIRLGLDTLSEWDPLFRRILDDIAGRLSEAARAGANGAPIAERPRAEQAVMGEAARRRSPAAPRPAPPAADPAGFTPSTSQQRILNSLLALELIGVHEPDKTQLALFAEASPKSSGYTNNLGNLRTHGLIDYPAPRKVSLTAAGRVLADAGNAPTTAAELQAYVYTLVGASRARIVQHLVDIYPDEISKAGLAEEISVSAASSGYTNNLGSLRSLGLIGYPTPGWVRAEPVLFLEGVPA